MSLSDTWEKLHTAVRLLAAGEDSVQDRLRDAYTAALIRIQPDALPEAMRDEFEVVRTELSKFRSEDQGIMAATKVIDAEQASDIAEKIVLLYDQITQQYGASREK